MNWAASSTVGTEFYVRVLLVLRGGISIHMETLENTEFLIFSHEPLSLEEISDSSFSQSVYGQYALVGLSFGGEKGVL